MDRGGNQALSSADIEELKHSGVAGSKIVEAIASASATFENKTAFSQAGAPAVPLSLAPPELPPTTITATWWRTKAKASLPDKFAAALGQVYRLPRARSE